MTEHTITCTECGCLYDYTLSETCPICGASELEEEDIWPED